MEDNLFGQMPQIVRASDGKSIVLTSRLITIGSSPKCSVILSGERVPAHIAHIVFTAGNHEISSVNKSCPVYLNGKLLESSMILAHHDKITIDKETWEYVAFGAGDNAETGKGATPLRRFIAALASFARTAHSDARFELLAGIAQLLTADGARLVAEQGGEAYVTIARYPQTSGLDRFSTRAIVWAKEKGKTVLMHETDWAPSGDSKGSLELNRIGSVLCVPLYEGTIIRGYLYVDRCHERQTFTEDERQLLDDVGPVFADLLALYEQTTRQRETIAVLQKSIELQGNPIVYECESMQVLIATAAKFGATDATILVTGETGSGKELFARFIHQHSNRAAKEFCAINCGALPENLIESELFGYEKGAFTGAHQRKKGLFERAHGGTVFLDEIGEVPLNLQVKLLRVLQEAEVLPLGATATIKVDVRVIAATNRNLHSEVQGGRFREDLFYRLNVLEIAIPPLRKRHRDVLLLADMFIKKYAGRFGIPEKGLALPAQAKLLGYSWPGNIRQLENAVQKALLVSKSTLLLDTDFELHEKQRQPSAEKISVQPDKPLLTLKDAKSAAEKQSIVEALKRSDGNVSVAARLLETDRKWLTKLMKLHGV